MARRKKQVVVAEAPAERFSIERFFGSVRNDPFMVDVARSALGSGYQLSARAVPDIVLPCVVILACYSRVYEDVELVDDYDRLIDDMRGAVSTFGIVAHPDLFMASCICILHQREEVPSYEAFSAINIPALFKQLVYLEE